MSVNYDSVVMFGTTSEDDYKKLPADMREVLNECQEIFDDEEGDWVNDFKGCQLVVDNFDTAGVFIAFGREISSIADEDGPEEIKPEIFEKTKALKAAFNRYGIEPKLFHYLYVG